MRYGLSGGTFAAAVGKDFEAHRVPGPGPQNSSTLMKRVEPSGRPSSACRRPVRGRVRRAHVREVDLSLATLLAVGPAPALSRPFAEVLDQCGVTDAFLRNWLDMICFLLQGATGGRPRLMAYMLSDFDLMGCSGLPEGEQIDHRRFIAGVRKNGDCASTRRWQRFGEGGAQWWSSRPAGDICTHCGLERPSGPRRRCSAPGLVEYFDNRRRVTRCDSFLHLHVGIDAAGLPTEPSESLPAQWAALDDWERGVDAPRNLVLVSMASMLDASLAPEGCHVIHAYVPAFSGVFVFNPTTTPSPRQQQLTARQNAGDRTF